MDGTESAPHAGRGELRIRQAMSPLPWVAGASAEGQAACLLWA